MIPILITDLFYLFIKPINIFSVSPETATPSVEDYVTDPTNVNVVIKCSCLTFSLQKFFFTFLNELQLRKYADI